MSEYKGQDPNQPLTEDVLLKALDEAEKQIKKPNWPSWYMYMNFADKQRYKAIMNGYESEVKEDF